VEFGHGRGAAFAAFIRGVPGRTVLLSCGGSTIANSAGPSVRTRFRRLAVVTVSPRKDGRAGCGEQTNGNYATSRQKSHSRPHPADRFLSGI